VLVPVLASGHAGTQVRADLEPDQLACRSVGSSGCRWDLCGIRPSRLRFWFRQVMAEEASPPLFSDVDRQDCNFDVWRGADEQTVAKAFQAWGRRLRSRTAYPSGAGS
jgi:hypothetical protein